MKKTIALLGLVLLVAPHTVDAKTRKSSSSPPVTINGNNQTYTNPAGNTVSGGTGTGVTVKGNNNTVVNEGTITGSTGVSMSGGGTSTFVNKGTITATSTGTSSATAVGVSQGGK